MEMIDSNDEFDNVNEIENIRHEEHESERKVLELMKQMAGQMSGGNVNPQKVEQMQSKNAMLMNIKPEDDSNYWEIKGIPTGYKMYPEGTVIKARPLKVLEVKKLTSLNEYNADSVINDILRKCIRGINIDDLYISDKLYLIFWLRANSFRDNKYVVEFDCPKCTKESTFHFEIDSINIDKIKDSYSENTIISLSNGDKLTLGYLKIKDENGMSSFSERYSNIITDSGDEIDEELVAVSFMIKTINGKHLDPLNTYNYVLGLNPQDYAQITTYIEENIVGVKPYMSVKCDKCGGDSQIGISFRPDFFLPKYRAE